MQIAFVNAVHAEGEVIHETKSVVWRPDTVQEVKQCVESHDRVAYVTLWESVEHVRQISVKLLVEVPFGHSRKQIKRTLLTQQRWKSEELSL